MRKYFLLCGKGGATRVIGETGYGRIEQKRGWIEQPANIIFKENLHNMHKIDGTNNPKVPAIIIDKKLEEYRGKVLFPEKLAKANAILEKPGLPDLKDERKYKE